MKFTELEAAGSSALSTANQPSSQLIFRELLHGYLGRLSHALKQDAMDRIFNLAEHLWQAWHNGRTVYLCGNGGSAANACHIANDFIFGAGVYACAGVRVEALSANTAVLTCLANDLGYEQIFAQQLRVKAQPGDILIALSGSGESENIVKAIEVANQMNMHTFAILGFSGGRSKKIVQWPIHFDLNDMQVCEDLQLIVGHVCMQWLSHQSQFRLQAHGAKVSNE